MFFIFSKSDLLEDIRNELGAILETTSDKDGKIVRNLDITTMKSNCPLLTSVYKECLRYRSIGTSVRQVMEDTLLDGKYHLKKDSMIQMPSRVIHMDSSVWGPDVEEFNPRRYLKEGDLRSQTTKRPPSAAFRAFGGGTTLCPGRHFATNEILAVISMCVLRFDIKPVAGGWVLPKTDSTNPAGILMEPDTDIEVEISPRDIFADGKWLFSLRNSKIVFAVTDEDQGT
jgi:cytochrome P450